MHDACRGANRAQPNKTGLPSVSGVTAAPDAKIPRWLVDHAEEEGRLVPLDPTVRICFLHKLYRQLQTRKDSAPRSDATNRRFTSSIMRQANGRPLAAPRYGPTLV